VTEQADPQPETPKREIPGWAALIGAVLARRDDRASGAYLSAVKAGISPATEMQARQFTQSHLGELSPRAASGARRAAAICAASTGAPAVSRKPLGESLLDLHLRENTNTPPSVEKPNSIITTVGALPLLDLESAVQAISQLVGRCAKHGIGVDYFDLARTLTFWGEGVTPQSQETRARIVSAFYTPKNLNRKASA